MKLALDAGHGINTVGRRCSKEFDPEQHREWWLNDRVARYLEERANEYENFEILRVDDRTGETDVKLATRCATANNAKADFFLSIHHNGGIKGGSGGGITAYSYPNSKSGSDLYRDSLYDAVAVATGLTGNRSMPKTTANFAVLRETSMPAVLIEHGFMDSSTDVPIIITDDFAKKCGYAEADCIAKKFGLTKKEKTMETYSDVKKNAWYYEAVMFAIENKFMVGNGTKFRPNDNVTRAELAQVIYNLYNLESKNNEK